ncbi:histone-arginine methyltransferase METTL23 [Parasteatoda tepidariorum]|uniref:histone-arginine methyltransferase METTL23 n=1 Tax=Parasteatoda tepidariorum TaxID=114398 RepID=UPI00077FBCC1|nr:methyltransferase-like protein 23 [Parasteatoda tepidariorum]
MDLKLITCADSFRNFHFTDETDLIYMSCSSSDSLCDADELHSCDHNCCSIKIKESLHSSCGMNVWPSAPILGKYIWHYGQRLKGKNVLELGAGTGLISILAVKCGVAECIVTDSSTDALKVAHENLILNNCSNFTLQVLPWGYLSPFLISHGTIDLVLGSDVFYDPQDFEDIIVTVSYVLKKNTDAEFWCAYEKRCSEWNIQHLLEKWRLCCEEINLDSFGAEGTNVADSNLPGMKEIRLFVFRSEQTKNSELGCL